MPQLLRLRFLICFRACRRRLPPSIQKRPQRLGYGLKFKWRSFDFALTGCAQDDTLVYFTTMFTSLPGTTMDFTTVLPFSERSGTACRPIAQVPNPPLENRNASISALLAYGFVPNRGGFCNGSPLCIWAFPTGVGRAIFYGSPGSLRSRPTS